MPTSEHASIPVAWLSHETLLNCCPHLSQAILALDEVDLAFIAKKVGNSLQETYVVAAEMALLTYLGVTEDADAEKDP